MHNRSLLAHIQKAVKLQRVVQKNLTQQSYNQCLLHWSDSCADSILCSSIREHKSMKRPPFQGAENIAIAVEAIAILPPSLKEHADNALCQPYIVAADQHVLTVCDLIMPPSTPKKQGRKEHTIFCCGMGMPKGSPVTTALQRVLRMCTSLLLFFLVAFKLRNSRHI